MSHGRALKVATGPPLPILQLCFMTVEKVTRFSIPFFCTNLHKSLPPLHFMHPIILRIEPVLSIQQESVRSLMNKGCKLMFFCGGVFFWGGGCILIITKQSICALCEHMSRYQSDPDMDFDLESSKVSTESHPWDNMLCVCLCV